jgi:hypothetical protein
MSHAAVTGSRCDACHNGSYTSQGTKGAYGTASYAGHVATSGNDCITCHATAQSGGYVSWAGGTYVHQVTDTNCSNCHNGVTATGLTTPPHIPVTGIQCSNCHVNTATSFTTYTMGTTGHAAVHATRCDACHSGAYKSQGTNGAQGPAHSAKSQDCGCCHVKSATTFASWSNPQTPAAGCTTTAKTLVPATPTALSAVKSALRSAATTVRTVIRSVTSKLSGASVQPSQRAAVVANAPASTLAKTGPVATRQPATRTPGPVVAPNGATNILFNNKPLATSTFVPAPAIGTAANVSNFAKIAPAGVNGAPKSGTGAASAIVAPAPAGAPGLTQNPPQNLSGVLRGASAQPGLATGGQQNSSLPTPQWQGFRPSLPGASPAASGTTKFNHATAQGSCASCHNGTAVVGKPPRHIPTNAPCEACHKSTTTFGGARFDHKAVTAACATCHNSTAATGKPPRHVATNAPCESCHKSTTTFGGARFDHTAVSAACATCHNGRLATGKPPRHLATNAPCETCHKTTTTFGGVRFDHKAVAAPCATCHNGNLATGKPPRHIASNAPCETCHKSTVAFDVARMDHASMTAPCVSCHNVSKARGAGQNHFVAALPCEACHRITTWTSVTYRHASAAYPNHGAAIGCIACHTANSQVVAFKFAAYKPDCAGCHAAEFRPQQHLKYVKPVAVPYSVAELKDCAGACHVYADKSLTTIQTRRPKQHRVNAGGW